MWFAERNANKIGRITPTGTVTEFATAPGVQPFYIAAGHDGNLWVTDSNLRSIGRMTPSGTFTQFTSGITPTASLEAITAGPDGNLWFTEAAGKIGRITTT